MMAECCESFAGTDVRGKTIPDSRSWAQSNVMTTDNWPLKL